MQFGMGAIHVALLTALQTGGNPWLR